MAIFSVDIADQDVDRVINSICVNYNYQSTIINQDGTSPNPETKAQFANRMVRKFLSDNVKRYEVSEAMKNIELQSVSINDPVV